MILPLKTVNFQVWIWLCWAGFGFLCALFLLPMPNLLDVYVYSHKRSAKATRICARICAFKEVLYLKIPMFSIEINALPFLKLHLMLQ